MKISLLSFIFRINIVNLLVQWCLHSWWIFRMDYCSSSQILSNITSVYGIWWNFHRFIIKWSPILFFHLIPDASNGHCHCLTKRNSSSNPLQLLNCWVELDETFTDSLLLYYMILCTYYFVFPLEHVLGFLYGFWGGERGVF